MSTLTSTPQRLGRYQLRFRIAMGGMGGVYLAKATGAGGVDKVVAVKLLHEHLASDEVVVKMFLDEARIASALNHVNVCSTFDFGEVEGIYYLVMEYLEGEPLNRVLKHLELGTDRHPLHPWLVARLLADAAEGLHAAHQLTGSDGQPLNVVHRDVSPHNIFVTYDGVTKVVDFGIARARERSSTKTEAGAFKGKFEYAAPEQISGGGVDRRADTWALGVCLWELLTGKRLFQREEYSAVARAVMRDAIPSPSSVNPDVPKEFDVILEQALTRDPAGRYQTAREFGRALREALARSGTAIDGPTIEEWLEALFPGDRGKRQALSAAVRAAGDDALLETVPSALKVSDTSTGSKRNFKSQSGSGARSGSQSGRSGSQSGRSGSQSGRSGSQSGRSGSQSGRSGSQSGRDGSQSGRAAPPVAAEPVATPEEELVPEPAPSSSKWLVLTLVALVVLTLGGAAAFFSTRTPESETELLARVEPEEPGKNLPTLIAVVGSPTPAPREVVDAGGAVAIVEARREVIDAGGAIAVVAREVIDAGAAPVAVATPPRATNDAPTLRGKVDAGVAPVAVSARTTRPIAAPVPVAPKPPPPVEPTPKPVAAAVRPAGNAGMVHFKTPGGVADVYVDGNKAGVTPLALSLGAGRHTFELKVEGFEFGGPRTLNVSPGGDVNIEVDLR